MSAPPASREGQSGRTYRVPGPNGMIEVPSVTNVLGVLMKYLAPSAVKITAEQAVTRYAELGEKIKASGQTAAIDWLKRFYREEWDRKRDIGTAVHDAIKMELLGSDKPWPTELAAHEKHWRRFLAEKQPEFEMSEATVFSLRPGFAGTLDAMATIKKRRTLFDVKTGADGKVYLEAVLQTAAYRHAPHVLLADGTVHEMPEVDTCAVLALTDKGYDLVEVRADAEAYRVFMYLLEVWKYQNGPGKTAIGALIPGAVKP